MMEAEEVIATTTLLSNISTPSQESNVFCCMCLLQDECCRSVNIRKNPLGNENCELLHGTVIEEPGLLAEDSDYDYYVLLQPNRDPTTFKCPGSRCLNGGRCVGGCGNKTSFCNCSLPYGGKYCEKFYPRSCKDTKEGGLGEIDGEYDLYLKWPECNHTAKIYCGDMDTGNPKEFITLPAGGNNNFGLHHNKTSGNRYHQQWTYFEKIRFNVSEMRVITNDFKFAHSNIPGVFHPYASAGDCITFDCSGKGMRGNFQVDLNGTNFQLSANISHKIRAYPQCFQRLFRKSRSTDRQHWSAYCGGYCGTCSTIFLHFDVEGC